MDSCHDPAPIDEDDELRRRAWRRAALRAREALSAGEHARINGRLVGHLRELLTALAPTKVAFCWPFRQEPDLRGMMAKWMSEVAGRCALLPVVLETDAPLLFRRWVPEMEMSHDRYGIAYPPRGGAIEPQVVLVPMNAFDAAGYRLGYGGGYFDRTLARLPAVAIGVGFELGRLDSVLPQPHDRPMDWLVTEKGAFRAARAERSQRNRR